MGEPRTASRYAGAAVTEGGAGGSAGRRVSRPVSAERFEPAGPADAPDEPAGRSTVVRPDQEAGERGDYPPDLVFIVDDAGQVLYVNRPLGALTEEDVIGSEIYDWIFPEQHTLIRQCLERVAETGAPAGCEIPGIQHYDADAWYECRVTPNLREGQIVSVTIIARDITRHKRAQQRMRTRLVELERLVEERDADLQQTRQSLEARVGGAADDVRTDRWFRTLLDAAGEAVFVSDRTSGRILDVNETGCRWLRRARDEVVGRTAAELDLEFPITPPQDADLSFTETRDTRRPLMLSGAHRRRDGSTFPVEVAVARHEIGDQHLVLAVVRDVKGRQQTQDALHAQEARYRALLEQSWDAVYVTTRAGVIVEANPAAVALFGAAPDELAGLDARALIPAAEDIRRWQRAMAEHGVVERLEVEFRRRDGTAFRGLLSAARLYDRDGHITGYHCLVRAGAASAAANPDGATVDAPPSDGAGTEAAMVTPPPAPPRVRGTVLIVEPNPERAVAIGEALHGAGYDILAERDPGRAAEHFREPDPALRAVVVGLEGEGAAGEWALRAIRGLDATIPLVAVVGNGRAAEALTRLDDVELLATLPAPVHPLALAQALRDLPPPPVPA